MTRPLAVSRRDLMTGVFAAALYAATPTWAQSQATDPLPSWNEGPSKKAIIDFVSRATREAGPDYIPVRERIATFDNDGTLWAEQPIYSQFLFAMDRVKALSNQHPEWKTTQPFKAALEDDLSTLASIGQHGLLAIVAATHSGMTTDEFATTVTDWITTARHPRFDRLYTEIVYQPMLELIAYMQDNGFRTYIVSGGGIEFMRAWTEPTYGIPPEQVIGSSGVTRYDHESNGEPVLIKEPKVEFVDDGPGKPVGINRFIGRRPVFSFGNSDGDKEMLEWTNDGDGLRFMGLVHHTDAVREWAYDRHSLVGRLDKALDEAIKRNWTVVDMKTEWRTIFPPLAPSRGVGGGPMR